MCDFDYKFVTKSCDIYLISCAYEVCCWSKSKSSEKSQETTKEWESYSYDHCHYCKN